jgi:hypothetical protein
VLAADAAEALRLAALTHDIERHFPGGPHVNLADPPDEPTYRDAHSRRSADFIDAWLREQGAAESLVGDVRRLVLLHEWGGTPAADLVQAADSLSFLEVNPPLVERWVEEGRCSVERGVAQHRWMLERIRLEPARLLAEPLYETAVRRLSGAS